jgi:hypothetical protein
MKRLRDRPEACCSSRLSRKTSRLVSPLPGRFNQNRMQPELSTIAAEVLAFIEQPPEGDSLRRTFDDVASRLLSAQRRLNPAFAAWCDGSRTRPAEGAGAEAYPAVPTEAFKHADLTSIRPADVTGEFHSSGTTAQVPSRHRHHAESLALYGRSALRGFERHVLARQGFKAGAPLPGSYPGARMLSLTPSASDAPRSSLVHMLASAMHAHGGGDARFLGRRGGDGGWEVDVEAALECLEAAVQEGRPVCAMGTAFNWVHLVDAMEARGWTTRLPAGSCLMETGGYKGRSREMSREDLHAAIQRHLGLAAHDIITEYGMTELSSQAYARGPGRGGVFRFLPWARARVMSPETGHEVADGEVGMVEVIDLANVWSVAAIRTSDLAMRRGDAFELVGRAATAEPRGCSRMSA